MNVEKAKTLHCIGPEYCGEIVSYKTYPLMLIRMCCADHCMGWRWHKKGQTLSTTQGFCGLGGFPDNDDQDA